MGSFDAVLFLSLLLFLSHYHMTNYLKEYNGKLGRTQQYIYNLENTVLRKKVKNGTKRKIMQRDS